MTDRSVELVVFLTTEEFAKVRELSRDTNLSWQEVLIEALYGYYEHFYGD